MSETFVDINARTLAIDTSVRRLGKLTAQMHAVIFQLMEARAALTTRTGAPLHGESEKAYAEARKALDAVPSLLKDVMNHLAGS